MKFIFLLLVGLMSEGRAFEIASSLERIPEANPVMRTRVTEGRTAFSFIGPGGWTIAPAPETERIILKCASLEMATVTIHISTNMMPANAGQFGDQIVRDLDRAVLLESFQPPDRGAPGLGIDVQHVISGQLPMITRLCVFKTPTGRMEISLTARQSDFPGLHDAWTALLNSFRFEKP